MGVKLEAVVGAIKTFQFKGLLLSSFFFLTLVAWAQDEDTTMYKKRVLETTEIDFLTSYYTQEGNNASVTGGLGDEQLTDLTPTFVVSIPLNDDDVLVINAGISAYSSASSAKVGVIDEQNPDFFNTSSGASSSDVWANLVVDYSHASDDRNKVWKLNASFAAEYDYTSIGIGGGYTFLFNQKNTELDLRASIYIDSWSAIYPSELRPFSDKSYTSGTSINGRVLQGNVNYAPIFDPFNSELRSSYSIGANFSQILSRRMQGMLMTDFVIQDGLLSTPFQRVYFSDIGDTYWGDFHLAEGIEILPSSRTKIAIGGRLNYYVNEYLVLRSYLRLYNDDWGLNSTTASIELPLKLMNRFTLYPSYRFYSQTAIDYFQPYNEHLSTEQYYTSDNDLSEYTANQYGLGIQYSDVLTNARLFGWGLKSINLKYLYYERNTGFKANLISFGIKFVAD